MYKENVPAEKFDDLDPRWGTGWSIAGLVLAVSLMWLVIRWLNSGVYYDGHIALILSYAVVWVPLLAASLLACLIGGTRSVRRDLGLKFSWLDALFGISVGLFARVIASLIEIALYGRMTGLGVTFGETIYDGWWVFGTILAPILISPFVEELFFRGLVQRSMLSISSRFSPAGLSVATSIVVSAVLFSILHLTGVTNPTAAAVLGLSTFVFGIGSGILAATTGRLGGSIVAHVTFNGSLVFAILLS